MVDAHEGVLFRVLGPFELIVGGRPASLGGARQRLVLAGLVANANAVVSCDRLIDIVWGDEPPSTALSTLQKYVHRLRGSVGDRLLTRAPGYLLRVDGAEADASRFESLLADATRQATAGELGDAIAAFDEALGLWRGPAWAEFADFEFVRAEVARLEGLRASALEDRMEVALAAGRHGEAIGELEAIVERYPLRERPRSQLMVALYRSGRHAEAVRAYDAFRRCLGEEVGLEPSASLGQLADAILQQKPELDWVPPPGARGRPALPAGLVTFLFTDIEGSTRLFRQVGRGYVQLLERHRRLVRAAVAAAGGVEVNSEGDGLFFAFSAPAPALAASVAAQLALVAEPWPPGARVRVRMGVHTGEAAPHNGDYIALAVNQAARVRDAAHGGQVLLTASTLAAIGGDAPPDCSMHGVGSFPLRDFDDGIELFEARHPALPDSFPPPRVGDDTRVEAPLPVSLAVDTEPLIGRTTELEWLEVLWQRAVAGEFVTALVHGPSGIGKSRLLAEFARRAHSGGARVTVSVPDADRSGNEPVLAVLDDFDRTTVDLLGSGAAGVFLLAAARQPIASVSNTRELHGLSHDEVGYLLADKIETVTAELAGAVHSETLGNPGRVHDVARRLRDREAEQRVQRALERVGAVTEEARALRDAIAGGVLERERLAAVAPEGLVLGVCPYKGLSRYEAADAPFFHGRERLVAALVARVAVDRFVGIIGASGSGKSSLVRAGLLPALSAGALPGSDAWPACAFTPGEHPIRSFAHALAPLAGVPGEELARGLDRQPDELGAVLEAALRGRDGTRVVLVADQFEEIMTLCRDQEERERFAGALVDAVTDPGVPAVVVPVVRADYYGALAVHPELGRLFEHSQLLVGAMTDSDLRRAITEPARRAGLVVDEELVDAVCADAGPESGALPLVSTAMAETWARRNRTTLTLAGYRDAGGVHGALARLADDVYTGLDDNGRGLARGLFLRVAEPGDGTDDVRRRMPRNEFSVGAASDEVLDAFVGRRLLVADGGFVEVAHEALLREWPRLRTWLEDDRDGRRLHRQLTLSASAWDNEGRDPSALYRGTRLDAALEWTRSHDEDINTVERDFLDRSSDAQHSELRTARRAARRFRSLAAALTIVLALALVAGSLALVQGSRANHQAAAARREAAAADDARTLSDATALASEAQLLPSDQLDVALLLAVQGRNLHESTKTDGALEAVLRNAPAGLVHQVGSGTVPSFCIDASPDGRLLAFGGADGTARLISTASGRVVRALPGSLGGNGIECVAFSPDGTKLVGSGGTPNVYIWDVASGRQLGATIHTTPRDTFSAFAGNDRIVTVTAPPTNANDGIVQVWDITDPDHPAPIGAPYAGSLHLSETDLTTRAFLAPGSDLLAFDNNGHTEVWDTRTHTLAYPPLPGRADSLSPDGTLLATTDADQVRLWDLATGHRRGLPITGFSDPSLDLFSPGGQRAAISSGGTVTIVNVATGAPVGNPITASVAIRYLADGTVLVGSGQTIEQWRPDATAPVAFATALAEARTPGFAYWLSPTTVYGLGPANGLAPFIPTGLVQEWDASTGAAVGDLLGRPLPAVNPGFGEESIVNAGGTLAALAEGATIELWDLRRHTRVALLPTGQQGVLPSWDPAAPILATTGFGGTLAFWDISDLAHIRLLTRTTVPGYPARLAGSPPHAPFAPFSPDGRTVAVEYAFPQVTLVSVPDGVVRHVLPAGPFTYGAVFTADSKIVATEQIYFNAPARVILWDVATGRQRSAFPVPYPGLGSIAFANADKWLVTDQSSFERGDKVRSPIDIWDVTTGEPVGDAITVPGDAGILQIDRPGGSRLLSSTTALTTGTYMIWDLNPDDWASLACGITRRNLTRDEWKRYLPGRPYQRTCPQWPAGT